MVTRLERTEILQFVRAVWDRMNEDGVFPFEHYRYPVPNPDAFISSWEVFTDAGVGAVYGFRDAKGPAGLLAGVFVPDVLSGVQQGQVILWLLHPEARKDRGALALLNEFEEDVKRSGGKWLIAGVTAEGPGALKRVYRRLGYVPDGVSFRKEL